MTAPAMTPALGLEDGEVRGGVILGFKSSLMALGNEVLEPPVALLGWSQH